MVCTFLQKKMLIRLIDLVYLLIIEDAMANSAKELCEPTNATKLDILRGALEKPCSSADCPWLAAALEVLQRNSIARAEWAEVVKATLQHGRGKGSNMMVVGPADSAKTFMLMPMVDIFDAFTSPAQGRFNLVGASTKEVIILDDFRWNEDVMEWGMLINLLDGRRVTIPQRNSPDPVIWSAIQPIFATANTPIRGINRHDTMMMDERWVVMSFDHQFTSPDRSIKRCARCFAQLILDNE